MIRMYVGRQKPVDNKHCTRAEKPRQPMKKKRQDESTAVDDTTNGRRKQQLLVKNAKLLSVSAHIYILKCAFAEGLIRVV